MSRIEDIRLTHVKRILSAYHFEIPLHHFLKNYFRENKQIGSKDRKLLRQYTYYWFRLGKAITGEETELRLAIAVFLNETETSPFFDFLSLRCHWKPDDASWRFSAAEKLKLVQISPADIFPWMDELCDELLKMEYIESFFKQPRLWLRARIGKEQLLEQQLQKQQLPFERNAEIPQAYALPNGSNPQAEGLAEVQDLSSQKVTRLFQVTQGINVWDCCAASGGKSLALADNCSGIHLFVSDMRERILENLQQRFAINGIDSYAAAVADLSMPHSTISFTKWPGKKRMEVPPGFFDLILVDAPCSGSGTWARTPEQLQQMNEQTVNRYAALQRSIVQNVLPFLKPQGLLVYSTCSVFAKENEQQTAFLASSEGLKIIVQQLIQGTNEGADTLFAAVCRKPE
ncbi:MAG: RsmB/NOP family class I SAM-dependent RNA methyltransferase [Bacteroidia bacterium]|nr:RsmB/NOP family class I SAM-dependent RNA methyltransferase [Bacteroidia bacterium]